MWTARTGEGPKKNYRSNKTGASRPAILLGIKEAENKESGIFLRALGELIPTTIAPMINTLNIYIWSELSYYFKTVMPQKVMPINN